MLMAVQSGMLQPEDNAADFQGLAHNMAQSTAIATCLNNAHTYIASKKSRQTLPSDEAQPGRS